MMSKICRILFCLITLLICGPGRLFAAESVKFESEFKAGFVNPVDMVIAASDKLLVLDAGASSVIAVDTQGKKVFSFGSNGNAPGQFANPQSLAISPNTRIVVADSGNHRVQVFNTNGESIFQFGAQGSLPGQFQNLSGLAVDAANLIFTADRDNNRIQIFTPNGIYLREIPTEGRVFDLSLDLRGNIYALVADMGKIIKFSNEGHKLREIICRASGRDEIAKTNQIKVDAWGDIYLVQSEDQQIIKIDPEGHVLLTFGSEGNARGQFSGVAGLETDEKGRLLVADNGNGRIQFFKISGSKKSPMPKQVAAPLVLDFDTMVTTENSICDVFSTSGWGLFMVSDKKSHVLVLSQENNSIEGEGSDPGKLLNPKSVYVTLDGRIYVADTGNNRVQIFNNDGKLYYQFGKLGSKSGQFNTPQGIAVNGKGMIYVADTGNNRVQLFNQDGIYLSAIQNIHSPLSVAVDSQDSVYVLDPEQAKVLVYDDGGNYLRSIGDRGHMAGQFDKPVDIALDENDNLYVADQATARIQIFDSKGRFVLSFGSPGTGGGYFKQLSSVSASEGNIFVTDYQGDQLQVFRYYPDGITGKPQRLYSTKTAAPLPGMDGNDVMRYTMAKKLAFSEALKDFIDSFGYSKEYFLRFVRIESIESLHDGHVKVTISVPKYIPKEIGPGSLSH